MESIMFFWKKWKNKAFGEVITEWKWILGYSKKYKKQIVFYIFLGIFGSIFSLLAAIASKQIVDIVTGYRTDKLLFMVILMVGMALFSLAFQSIITRISLKISIDIQNDIQADIFKKIEDAQWLELSRFHSGDILNRFDNDVNVIAVNAITWLPSLVVNLFQFIAVFLVIFYYDVVMALISLACAPILLLSSSFLLQKMRKYSKRVRVLNSQIMAFEQESFSNMTTIKSFGITSRYLRKLRDWQRNYKDYSLDYNLYSIKTNILLSIIALITQYAAFMWGVYRLWTGGITYGEMTLFLTQCTKLTNVFSDLLSFIPNAMNASVAAGRVMELVSLPREIHKTEETEKMQKEVQNGLTVSFDSLYFEYVEGKPVLEQCDFIAKPNEIVALVGTSGEGKTTVLRMILGLIFPTEGHAYLTDCNGINLELNADTRRFFSYVPQGNTIFSGSIAENLRMIHEGATEEEMVEALKMACAWEFVEQLPDGLNGTLQESGGGLSEGQAQRIAIARALLSDAPILLLDEATSALDEITERKVLQNIMERKKNKTCIIATHRPSVLEMCKRVYRISDQKIVCIRDLKSN